MFQPMSVIRRQIIQFHSGVFFQRYAHFNGVNSVLNPCHVLQQKNNGSLWFKKFDSLEEPIRQIWMVP